MAGKVRMTRCDVCKRKVRVRGDGQLARHRDTWANWCPNGAQG